MAGDPLPCAVTVASRLGDSNAPVVQPDAIAMSTATDRIHASVVDLLRSIPMNRRSRVHLDRWKKRYRAEVSAVEIVLCISSRRASARSGSTATSMICRPDVVAASAGSRSAARSINV